MAIRLTQKTWEAKGLDAEARMFLLALSEIVVDRGDHAEIASFADLTLIEDMLDWNADEVDHYARPAFGMEEDYPLGDISGTTFVWDEAIDRIRALIS